MGLGTEQARRIRTTQRGWWFAMTGLYANWHEVEARLLELGELEAPRCLNNPQLRAAMDRVCVDSIAARTRWRAAVPELYLARGEVRP